MNKKIEHILLGREKKITEEELVKQPLPHKDFRFANLPEWRFRYLNFLIQTKV